MDEKLKHLLKEWIIPLALEVLAVVLIVKYVCFLAVVPTGSMIPTIDEHSWLFATRMYNPEKHVKRGDILVFDSVEMNETLLKRCVALPGDHVVVEPDGTVSINGEPSPEPYVVNTQAQGTRLEYNVPEGHFLFFGDNRSNSVDARYWEQSYIPGDAIQGKAWFTLWPLRNFGPLK